MPMRRSHIMANQDQVHMENQHVRMVEQQLPAMNFQGNQQNPMMNLQGSNTARKHQGLGAAYNPMADPLSPFFLHPSESSSSLLISFALTPQNYNLWA